VLLSLLDPIPKRPGDPNAAVLAGKLDANVLPSDVNGLNLMEAARGAPDPVGQIDPDLAGVVVLLAPASSSRRWKPVRRHAVRFAVEEIGNCELVDHGRTVPLRPRMLRCLASRSASHSVARERSFRMAATMMCPLPV